jgi:hypothetical protein
VVRQDQRERTRYQARDAVPVDVDRIAEPELDFGQDLAAIGIEHDVLARAEERDRRGQVRDRPEILRRMQLAECRNRGDEQELRDEHPAAATAERRKGVAIHERRPEELPRVRQLDQREEADRFEVHVLRAQPRGQQVDEEIERKAG